jgi:large subunit ribosomal protein L23
MAEENKEVVAEEVKPAKKTTKKTATKKTATKKVAEEKKEAATKKAPAEKKSAEKKPAAKKATKKAEKAEEKVEVKEFKFRKPTQKDFEVIKGPYVTEKTQALQNSSNKMTFKVASNTNASEVKAAVQAIFGVKVDKVNIINVLPRSKRVTRYEGHVPGFKKAIVTVNKEYNLGEIAKAAQSENN